MAEMRERCAAVLDSSAHCAQLRERQASSARRAASQLAEATRSKLLAGHEQLEAALAETRRKVGDVAKRGAEVSRASKT